MLPNNGSTINGAVEATKPALSQSWQDPAYLEMGLYASAPNDSFGLGPWPDYGVRHVGLRSQFIKQITR